MVEQYNVVHGAMVSDLSLSYSVMTVDVELNAQVHLREMKGLGPWSAHVWLGVFFQQRSMQGLHPGLVWCSQFGAHAVNGTAGFVASCLQVAI